jgi:predicted dehydrogenase
MKSQSLRVGVVGVGHLGKFHAQKIKIIPQAQLVAVCDLNVESATSVAKELQVEAVNDYRQLKGQVDAVIIASSTTSHFEIGEFFLKSKVHVFVEKPITTSREEARKLCKLAEENHLKLQVGHVERFNPALISAIAKLQKPLFIECHRLAPFKPRSVDVDVVLDLMIHDIDVILSLVKSKPVQVQAIGTPVMTSQTDIANARVEFESGTVANITASRVSQQSQRKFRVFQENQYLSIDFGTAEVNLLTKKGKGLESLATLEAESWNLGKGDALLTEDQAFVQAILDDQACVVTGEDGLIALELAEQIMADIHDRLS